MLTFELLTLPSSIIKIVFINFEIIQLYYSMLTFQNTESVVSVYRGLIMIDW